jgi:hypothetical protein
MTFQMGYAIIYAIGTVIGLIGALKVHYKWKHGDYDSSRVVRLWFGICIFLVILAATLKVLLRANN